MLIKLSLEGIRAVIAKEETGLAFLLIELLKHYDVLLAEAYF